MGSGTRNSKVNLEVTRQGEDRARGHAHASIHNEIARQVFRIGVLFVHALRQIRHLLVYEAAGIRYGMGIKLAYLASAGRLVGRTCRMSSGTARRWAANRQFMRAR